VAIILYHQTIEMMSRQINLILGVVSCILLCYSNVTAQAEKSVFLIQVFKSDSTLLRDGTGFFMDGNHGYTYAFIFRNGAFARAITQDSSVHNVVKINGFDPATGLTRIELDNMLSAKISKLSSVDRTSEEGATIKILYAKGVRSVKSQTLKITKKDEFIGYGETFQVSSKLGPETSGGPVLNAAGNAEGFVLPLNESNNQGDCHQL
jgi:hypothetical protein